jgi:reactive intermediate/imine deaminase
MATYLVNHLRIPNAIPNPEGLEYLEKVEATFLPYGGKWLVLGQHDEVLEGAWPGSVVLMEFPDRDAANAWYNSPAYQEILHLRTDNVVSDVILVDQVAPDFTSTGFAQQVRAAQADRVDSGNAPEVVRTEEAPAPFEGAPYSQAIRANGFVFVSGQLALDPGHLEIVGDTIEEQTEKVFDNLQAILEEAGSRVDRLVKTTVFLTDLVDFAAMNEVYARRVGQPSPARSTVEIRNLPSGAKLEIEAIAVALPDVVPGHHGGRGGRSSAG